MNTWPGLWPGLAWPQAITASGRFRGLGFLTRGLALAWPQAADSGRPRPWLGHGLGQPIDTEIIRLKWASLVLPETKLLTLKIEQI